MKKNFLGNTLLIVIAFTLATDYACKKSEDNTTNPPKTYSVKLATDATHGQYLVDKNGYTLYFFSNDFNGRNSCAGGCAAIWPYFYAGGITKDSLGNGLNIADFDTIHVGNKLQTRYKGWPLYYYAPGGTSREPAGQITGESVANWFVAKPDYTIMLSNGQLVGADGKNYMSNYTEGTGKTVYFTDAKGITLYIFTPDSFNINKYTKADFSNNGVWPIYDTTKVVVPSSLDKSLFSSITVFGRHQLTYKGWPLYYYGPDNMNRGNTKGITIPSPGTLWPVAVKDLNQAPKK